MPARPMAERRPPIVVGIEAHEQRDENRDRDRVACLRDLDGVERERQQRDGRQQEHDRELDQQDREGDLVRSLLAARAFDHGDHAIEERFALIDGDANDEPVREHARPAGHRTEVAAGFANHRCRFARDRRLVDRRHALDHLAVGRDVVPGFDDEGVALAQRRGLDERVGGTRMLCTRQLLGHHIALRRPQGVGLCLAATFGDRLGEVGEEHREPQPERHGENEGRRRFPGTHERLNPEDRGEDAADPDHEHDRVAPLVLRQQLDERILERLPEDRAGHQDPMQGRGTGMMQDLRVHLLCSGWCGVSGCRP